MNGSPDGPWQDATVENGRAGIVALALASLLSSFFSFLPMPPALAECVEAGSRHCPCIDPKSTGGTDKSGVDAVKNRLWSWFSVMCIRLCAYMEQAALIVAS